MLARLKEQGIEPEREPYRVRRGRLSPVLRSRSGFVSRRNHRAVRLARRRRTEAVPVGDFRLLRSLIDRQQREQPSSERAQRTKMAIVEGEQSTGAPSLCEKDNAQIGESDIHIGVATFEVDDDTVTPAPATNREPAGRQVIEECETSAPTEPTSEQIVDFGCYGGRDDKFPGLLLQQRLDSLSDRVSPVSKRHQRRCVQDQGHPRNPREGRPDQLADRTTRTVCASSKREVSVAPCLGLILRMARRMTSACDVPSRSASLASRAVSSAVR